MAEPRDRLAPSNLRAILDAWCSRHTLDSFPWIVDPTRVEVPVTGVLYEAPDGMCLCGHGERKHASYVGGYPCEECPCKDFQNIIEFLGKLDLQPRLRRNPKVFCVVDNKSTWRIDQAFVKQYLNDSQITGYMWLTAQDCGIEPHEVIGFINAIEVSLIPGSTKKCPTHSVPYSECGPEHVKHQVVGPIERTPDQIERWRRDATNKALAYRRALMAHTPQEPFDLPMEGTFTGACGRCEMYEWCTADRPPTQLAKMFAKSMWDPRAHAFGTKAKALDPLVFTIDNSTLKSAYTCTTQAVVRYGWGYTTNDHQGPLHAGTLVHSALEGFFKTGSPIAALEAFDEAVEHLEDA